MIVCLSYVEKDSHFWKELGLAFMTLMKDLRGSAIEAVAKFMQRWWQAGEKEKVRNYIRNLFWSIMDESRRWPEWLVQTIAEIISEYTFNCSTLMGA